MKKRTGTEGSRRSSSEAQGNATALCVMRSFLHSQISRLGEVSGSARSVLSQKNIPRRSDHCFQRESSPSNSRLSSLETRNGYFIRSVIMEWQSSQCIILLGSPILASAPSPLLVPCRSCQEFRADPLPCVTLAALGAGERLSGEERWGRAGQCSRRLSSALQ